MAGSLVVPGGFSTARRYNGSMGIAAGRVVGKGDTVELDGERLPRGGRVVVYFGGRTGAYVDEEAKAELLESMAQADRGETRPVEGLIARLKAKTKTKKP